MCSCTTRTALFVCACAFSFSSTFSGSAAGQEVINMPAATQPSTGRIVLRNQIQYLEARDNPRTGDHDFHRYTVWNNIAIGLRNDISVNLSVPIRHMRSSDDAGSRERDFGIGDVTAQLKWRVHQHDFGPIDTSRFSIFAGVQLPTFDRPFSTESFNPILGGVYTHVQGRHGFNLAGQYKFNTGSGTRNNVGGGDGRADALMYDGSYLYRLWPAQYAPDTPGAWYGIVELNGIYETNGDNELFISPGIMYEARTWTVEASVKIPAWQEVDHRPETRFVAVLGLRLLF